ncbi:MAG: hypothetical protein O6857_08490 [Nitrospinae bacterium]|nr:hypothetical protein [Nitrospinota bacterium]
MKKFAVLVGLALIALIVDGTLSYDIFDTRLETLKFWFGVALIVILGLVIVVADHSKSHHDGDDSR